LPALPPFVSFLRNAGFLLAPARLVLATVLAGPAAGRTVGAHGASAAILQRQL